MDILTDTLAEEGVLELLNADGTPMLYVPDPTKKDEATGEPITKPVIMMLASGDSKRVKTAQRLILNKRVAQSGRRNKNMTVEEVQAGVVELAVASVTDWEGITSGGKPWPCTPANVKTLFSDDRFAFILEQVQAFIGDRTNFMSKPQATS